MTQLLAFVPELELGLGRGLAPVPVGRKAADAERRRARVSRIEMAILEDGR